MAACRRVRVVEAWFTFASVEFSHDPRSDGVSNLPFHRRVMVLLRAVRSEMDVFLCFHHPRRTRPGALQLHFARPLCLHLVRVELPSPTSPPIPPCVRATRPKPRDAQDVRHRHREETPICVFRREVWIGRVATKIARREALHSDTTRRAKRWMQASRYPPRERSYAPRCWKCCKMHRTRKSK